MKLSENAIQAINNSGIRVLIASILGVGENTIRNYINANDENGELTKVKVLDLIHEKTGLTQEEILTETPVTK